MLIQANCAAYITFFGGDRIFLRKSDDGGTEYSFWDKDTGGGDPSDGGTFIDHLFENGKLTISNDVLAFMITNPSTAPGMAPFSVSNIIVDSEAEEMEEYLLS